MNSRYLFGAIFLLAMCLLEISMVNAGNIYNIELGNGISGFRVVGRSEIWADLSHTTNMTFDEQRDWAYENGFGWASYPDDIHPLFLVIAADKKFTPDEAAAMGVRREGVMGFVAEGRMTNVVCCPEGLKQCKCAPIIGGDELSCEYDWGPRLNNESDNGLGAWLIKIQPLP